MFRSSQPVYTWQDAELLAVEHMVHLGFLDATPTPPGADQGLDATSSRAAAQVKFRNATTPAPDVQQLTGAAVGYEHRLFYSFGYTKAAVEFAERAHVALFTFDRAGAIRPASSTASALWRGAAATLSDPDERRKLEQARKFEERMQTHGRELAAQARVVTKAARGAGGRRPSRADLRRRTAALRAVQAALKTAESAADMSQAQWMRTTSMNAARRKMKHAAKGLGIKFR